MTVGTQAGWVGEMTFEFQMTLNVTFDPAVDAKVEIGVFAATSH